MRSDRFPVVFLGFLFGGFLCLGLVACLTGTGRTRVIEWLTVAISYATCMLVWYYLVETSRLRRASQESLQETRRLRQVAEREREPFVVIRFDARAPLPDPSPNAIPGSIRPRPALFAVNLGAGPAVGVQIQGLPQWMRTLIPAISSAPNGVALLGEASGMTVDMLQGMRATVRCTDPSRPGEVPYSWTWIGDPADGDGFRLTTED